MSYYYNYFIGYKFENKIYPFGMYNSKGHLVDVLSKSSSFASDLHNRFHNVTKEMYSEELIKDFQWYYEDDSVFNLGLKYLSVNDLPTGSYIKKGYFLIEDIEKYEKDGDTWDIFYDYLDPITYTRYLDNELKFGKPVELEYADGEKYTKSMSNYTFYAYPDYSSEEYESWFLREVVSNYEYDRDLPKGAELVILETEG